MPRDSRKDALMPRIRLPLILITLVGCAAGRQPAPPQISVALPLAAPALGASEVASEPDARECSLPDKTATAHTQTGSMDVRTVAFDESQQANSTEPAPSAQPLPLTSLPERPALDPRHEYPLDLTTTLALVAGESPQVQFAQWRIEEAYAQLAEAEVLWLPSLQAGVSYHRHDGTYQASSGDIVDVNRSSLQGGFGAGAVGAGTVPNPGVVARFHTTDAIFAPRIAERTAWARGHAAKATLNDQLLAAALAYLEMLDAAQQQAIAQETLTNTLDLAELTDSFAETGQGLQTDADRMAAELAVRRNDLIRAEEAIAVASVRLAEVASFDMAVRLVPVETTLVPIDLVPGSLDPHGLVVLGLNNRPELQEARCLVAEACERMQREKYAPLLPSLLLGLSYSGFGGGLGDQIGSMHDRADFDALALWEVRNLGFGERAARDTARTRIEQRRWEQVRLMDRVAREIAEAAAQVESRRQQIDVSQEAIAIARLSHERNLDRIRQGQGLPIEALQSVQALNIAQREYLRAVVSYDEAQFSLHRALGWPVSSHPL
jgi:outer membrane protein TolC